MERLPRRDLGLRLSQRNIVFQNRPQTIEILPSPQKGQTDGNGIAHLGRRVAGQRFEHLDGAFCFGIGEEPDHGGFHVRRARLTENTDERLGVRLQKRAPRVRPVTDPAHCQHGHQETLFGCSHLFPAGRVPRDQCADSRRLAAASRAAISKGGSRFQYSQTSVSPSASQPRCRERRRSRRTSVGHPPESCPYRSRSSSQPAGTRPGELSNNDLTRSARPTHRATSRRDQGRTRADRRYSQCRASVCVCRSPPVRL